MKKKEWLRVGRGFLFFIMLVLGIGVAYLHGVEYIDKYFHENPFKTPYEYIVGPKAGVPNETLSCLDKLSKRKLKQGAGEMKKHKVVIAGITRDNAPELPIVIDYIEKTGQLFKDYRVVLFENDSHDKTKDILGAWKKKNNKVNILSHDFKNTKRPSIAFLATARNFYIQELARNSEYNDFDILMVLDLDMKYGWDMRGLFDSFSQFKNWDMVCSNGVFNNLGRMYDMFAFRNDEFPEKLSYPYYYTKIVPKGQRPYKPGSALVPVQSCFGGIAFYKRDKVQNCQYDSIKEDCEHIPFHECIRKNGGSLYMNPAQVIRYSIFE